MTSSFYLPSQVLGNRDLYCTLNWLYFTPSITSTIVSGNNSCINVSCLCDFSFCWQRNETPTFNVLVSHRSPTIVTCTKICAAHFRNAWDMCCTISVIVNPKATTMRNAATGLLFANCQNVIPSYLSWETLGARNYSQSSGRVALRATASRRCS